MRIRIARRDRWMGREAGEGGRGTRGTRVCGIACGGEIKRTRFISVSCTSALSLCPSFCFHLFDSLSLFLSLVIIVLLVSWDFSFPFSVAPELLWQTRYQFLTFARERVRSRVSLLLSLLLDDYDDDDDPTPVLFLPSYPLALCSLFLRDEHARFHYYRR